MTGPLTPFDFLALAGLLVAIVALVHILTSQARIGSVVIAAALSAGFAAFTAVTIWADGVMPVITNHTSNLWGVQVWWDLLFAVLIALFLIAPRARAVGMNMPLWSLFVVATASIGLLAMCARLFWLEAAAQGETKGETPRAGPSPKEAASPSEATSKA